MQGCMKKIAIFDQYLTVSQTRTHDTRYRGATEIAGVDNVARAKKQGLKTREWTSRHEKAAVDIARVDNVARRSKGGQRGSGQGGTKKQGWTTQE